MANIVQSVMPSIFTVLTYFWLILPQFWSNQNETNSIWKSPWGQTCVFWNFALNLFDFSNFNDARNFHSSHWKSLKQNTKILRHTFGNCWWPVVILVILRYSFAIHFQLKGFSNTAQDCVWPKTELGSSNRCWLIRTCIMERMAEIDLLWSGEQSGSARTRTTLETTQTVKSATKSKPPRQQKTSTCTCTCAIGLT